MFIKVHNWILDGSWCILWTDACVQLRFRVWCGVRGDVVLSRVVRVLEYKEGSG